jgi:hypothetical protein
MSAAEIRPIDVHHLGRSRVICAWLVGDVLIDPGPAVEHRALLDGLDGVVPRADRSDPHPSRSRRRDGHARRALAGRRGRRPRARRAPHDRPLAPARERDAPLRRGHGAPLGRGPAGPARSASRCCAAASGSARSRSPTRPVTPPTTSATGMRESRTAFVGDVAGVRIEPLDYVLAPTPPPDIDIEAWHASIALIRRWQPERLAITHFGAAADPQAHLDRSSRSSTAGPRAPAKPTASSSPRAARRRRAQCGPEDARCYQQGAPYEHIYDGLARYWSKREARVSSRMSQTVELPANRRPRQRQRRRLEGDRPQRQPQHLRPRRRRRSPA